MDPITLGAFALGAYGLSQLGQTATGYLNYTNQMATLAFQKKQWHQIKAREDNAMQRRVADLRKAGLSPTLAVGGGGAGASSGPQIITPQLDIGDPAQAISSAMALAQQKASIDQTVAQKELTELQQVQTIQGFDKTATEIMKIKADTGKSYQEALLKGVETQKAKRDLAINIETGSVSDPSPVGKVVRDVQLKADSIYEQQKAEIQRKLDDVEKARKKVLEERSKTKTHLPPKG